VRFKDPPAAGLPQIDQAKPDGAWATLVRGLRLSPEFRQGLAVTLALALAATAGRVVVPITIQQVIDRGLGTGAAGAGSAGVDLPLIIRLILFAFGAVAVTAVAGTVMNYRLARATEHALSALRVRTFRHIHDLSLLHHASEHRGTLVSRVTADIDTISRFMQWGGVVLVANVGQLVVALAVMLVYSWQLTLVVVAVFAPLAIVLRRFQGRLAVAYDLVRRRVGEMLGAISESVVGAPVIRAYAIEDRTNQRISRAVRREFEANYRAVKVGALMFSSGELFAAAATAAVIVVGVLLGVGGGLTPGRLIAFLFLVTLFVGPVQVATEVLDQAQTAIAGWRRVLNVLDTTPDIADPPDGVPIPPGPIAIRFEHVDFAYPARADEEPATVLNDVDLEIAAQSRVAIVGETGSGKTTFAKLLTRLMDPTSGRVLVNGVPLTEVRFDSLRRRIVMVPQDGFLFDDTVTANVLHGRSGLGAEDVRLAFVELGLADWLEHLPDGLDTRVGERGESLSVGERQLVALARAYVANPDLLVLDEATSAVDPATEVRIQRALDGLTRGRTAVAIAHRLSTAEAADEVLVFDGGRLVQRGPHAELVAEPGVYAELHASWMSGTRV
jgi:putative ABC transport system ATP-binding protein